MPSKNSTLDVSAPSQTWLARSTCRTISRKGLNQEDTGFFLAGFTEGEGSFNVSLRSKRDYRVNWQVVLSFNVSQKDPTILYLLKEELNCGIIKTRRDGLYSLDVTNTQDISKKVLPYFKKFPFLSSSKRKNFAIFSKIVELMVRGRHKDMDGLKKILQLREKLNEGKGRKRKYSYKDIFQND